ncbi:hypothetical protein [Macrococcus equi]|uniref:hypothetical protein n=1 Tax=Macrococcus equi TaxID=3395462 RepID=UPI00105DCADE|nr:hypothetical protein [Macrococcus goetzii]TDM39080.1 hypothetical protein ETI10_12550 [Macrococcus goetzii]
MNYLQKIAMMIALLIVTLLITTHDTYAATHVVLAVGPNNAIVSSLFIGIGAVGVMILDKFKHNDSSED